MDFCGAMNYFYYRSSVNELRWMNDGDTGLTYNSLLYLNVIAYTPDCTTTKLSETIRITMPAVTIKVNELCRRGFVVKEQSLEDKRVHFLRLSPTTEEVYGMYDRLGEATERMLLSKYTQSELDVFSQMLRDIAEFQPEEV